MNEENNQNAPILGSSGGEKVPFPSGTYKIKFTDEYYSGLSDTGKLIKGRMMLIQNDGVNDGNYFIGINEIYDDAFVDEYVSHFDTENWMPILGGPGFFEEHSGIMYEDIILDYEMVGGMFAPNIEYHFALDEEWYNKHYGEDSNKVLRTFATGQSDITRHESYFKEEMSPNYKFQDASKEIIELMKLLGVEKPEDISFNIVGNGGSLGVFTDDSGNPEALTVIANQYEYQEKAGESIKSYHYTLDDADKNELLNYSKAVVSNAWEPLEGASYFILSSGSMEYLDGKATVLGGQK